MSQRLKDPLLEEGFSAQEIEQARAWQRLSAWDRLAWLAQAKEFASMAMTAAARRRAHEQPASEPPKVRNE